MTQIKLKTTKATVTDDIATGREARRLRKSLRINAQELADAIGSCRSYLYDLETGRKRWSDAIVKRINDGIKKVLEAKRRENRK